MDFLNICNEGTYALGTSAISSQLNLDGIAIRETNKTSFLGDFQVTNQAARDFHSENLSAIIKSLCRLETAEINLEEASDYVVEVDGLRL